MFVLPTVHYLKIYFFFLAVQHVFEYSFSRYDRFADETRNIGQERVETVNTMADQLINANHTDSSTILEWKNDLNEAWQNLLELLVTRREVSAYLDIYLFTNF